MFDAVDEKKQHQVSHPDVYISELTFNNAMSIPIKQDDIVVFVGSNNVGKSQCLRDIWNITKDFPHGIIVNDISVFKDAKSDLKSYMSSIATFKCQDNHNIYQGLNFYVDENLCGLFLQEKKCYYTFREVFICFLKTDNRLSVCTPPEIIDRTAPPRHPIHVISHNASFRKKITEYFAKAFNCSIFPNTQHGKTIPLCLGEIPEMKDISADDAQDFVEKYAQKLEQYPVLHDQGDGMRSFSGILLYLSVDHFRTFLMDEPEAFLHPPQAVIMGRIIAESLSNNQQAFISTHSQHLIKGLLAEAPERVKIIRITRNGNHNNFSVLDNAKIRELWSDPLLKHSEIMDGMFYNNVVVCESDADCRFYSIINSFLKEKNNSYPESLFVHCGGKHRMAKVVAALKSLNIEFKVIPDIDILNEECVICDLVKESGGDWESLRSSYRILISNIENVSNLSGKQIIEKIREEIGSEDNDPLPKEKLKKIQKIAVPKSRWDGIKHAGIAGVPRGQAYEALSTILSELEKINIFIVPCGELECFVKSASGHGPEWVNNVLEKYPDLDDSVFNSVKEFILSWKI